MTFAEPVVESDENNRSRIRVKSQDNSEEEEEEGEEEEDGTEEDEGKRRHRKPKKPPKLMPRYGERDSVDSESRMFRKTLKDNVVPRRSESKESAVRRLIGKLVIISCIYFTKYTIPLHNLRSVM